MGYRHSWARPVKIDRAPFEAIVRDFERLLPPLARMGIQLGDAWGERKPIVHEDKVCFNGLRDCRCEPRPLRSVKWMMKRAFGEAPGLAEASCDDEWSELRCTGCCTFETFSFPRIVDHGQDWAYDDGRVGGSCKTNRRPYDLAVTAALLIAKRHLGDSLTVHSDAQTGLWTEPQTLCQIVLGYGDDMRVAEPWPMLRAG